MSTSEQAKKLLKQTGNRNQASAAAGPELGVRRAAGMLGVHENTLRRWVSTGKLSAKHRPVSKFLRFREEDIMALKQSTEDARDELDRWLDEQDAVAATDEEVDRCLARLEREPLQFNQVMGGKRTAIRSREDLQRLLGSGEE
ncbi:MAG TPA: helix-turn-helix domain-containing protein [Chloroflexota bacterium]|jgi:DNA-binding transcriptional MerR regulator